MTDRAQTNTFQKTFKEFEQLQITLFLTKFGLKKDDFHSTLNWLLAWEVEPSFVCRFPCKSKPTQLEYLTRLRAISWFYRVPQLKGDGGVGTLL